MDTLKSKESVYRKSEKVWAFDEMSIYKNGMGETDKCVL